MASPNADDMVGMGDFTAVRDEIRVAIPEATPAGLENSPPPTEPPPAAAQPDATPEQHQQFLASQHKDSPTDTVATIDKDEQVPLPTPTTPTTPLGPLVPAAQLAAHTVPTLRTDTAAGRSTNTLRPTLFSATTTLPPNSLYPVNKPLEAGNIDPVSTSQQHFPHWPFGAGAACFAALFFVIGMQLLNRGVRAAHSRPSHRNQHHPHSNDPHVRGNKEKDDKDEQTRKRSWCCGISFLFLSFSAQAVALTMAALSLVQPMASLSIVLNALVVPSCFPMESKMLKDTEWITMRGVIIVVMGNVLIVLAASKINTAYAAEELESLFLQVDFILFEVVCLVLGFVVFQFARNASARYHGARGPFMLFYAYTAGWAGAQQYMFLKAVGECVKSGIHGRAGAALFSATPIIMCLCCLFLAVLQLWLVVHGLSRFRNETVRFIGCYQGCVVCIGAATGGFYFNEFDQFTQYQWVCFTVGVLLIVWGVLIMSTLRGKTLDNHLQKRGGQHSYSETHQVGGAKYGLCSRLYCYHVCGPCRALLGAEGGEHHGGGGAHGGSGGGSGGHGRAGKGLTTELPEDYFDPMEHAHFAQLWANPDIW
jgi:hypothetical protein